MKIAIVVHGRFHAFDLVRALLKRGNDVTLFTNYPHWAVARFGIPADRARTFPLHGVVSRITGKIQTLTGWSLESWTHPMFSRWALRHLRRERWDVIHAWSGVAEEIYRDVLLQGSVKLVLRGSAHICTQAAILAEEQKRVSIPIDRPTPWMIDREQREYALTHRIVVLSTFAYNSFRNHGVPDSKLHLLPLGTETSAFRPTAGIVAARRGRILSGEPLHVLYVGNTSFQKGLTDFRRIIEESSGRFLFRFVGHVTPEAKRTVLVLRKRAEFVKRKPQRELPLDYAWADVFLFPTIQDGYAVVLAQASASGLPILATTNCCGPDLIQEGRTGWVLPIRDPQAFLARLNWCDSHRDQLAAMVTAAYSEFKTRDWSDVAADFEAACRVELDSQTPAASLRSPVGDRIPV
jgi:glycosyltransferase involved in cell wall biosynthesis